MTERSGYVLKTLREGWEFTLLPRPTARQPIAAPGSGTRRRTASPESLRRLEHEYSLAAELDPKWATRPLALTRHEGQGSQRKSD
jgi:hypothetical protein